MLAPDCFDWLLLTLSLPQILSGSASVWAYVGLGPGQEFIPHFVAMMGLLATAVLAVVQWPILALWSRLSRAYAARKKTRPNPASADPAVEQPGEQHPNQS
jgi:hypothetical protein